MSALTLPSSWRRFAAVSAAVARSGCLIALLSLCSAPLSAEPLPEEALTEGALREAPPQVMLRAFLDSYYAYDFAQPGDNLRPGFLYNHNRHNEFSLNMALLDVGYQGDRARAQLGLMAGTYAQYNYAAEQELLRNVFEAWAGVQLFDDVWWDAGIFPSHIGYESAISTVNPTLTRSLASESTPYFLSGTRLYWTPNAQWTLGVTLANGWQNIIETPGNDSKGVGTQVVWTPDPAWSFNSSAWVSDEFPNSADRLRVFHDFYGSYTQGRLMTLLGADVGAQQREADGEWDVWWSTTALARVAWSERVATALRFELYQDPDQVIIASPGAEGVRLVASSLNLDVALAGPVWWRVEARAIRDANAIFVLADDPSRYNVAVTTSLAIDFQGALSVAAR